MIKYENGHNFLIEVFSWKTIEHYFQLVDLKDQLK